MTDPWTLTGPRVYLPAEGFGCDEVREGPVTIQRNGRVFLTYSACDTGKPDYKLGLLVAGDDADLMDPAAWRQHPAPGLHPLRRAWRLWSGPQQLLPVARWVRGLDRLPRQNGQRLHLQGAVRASAAVHLGRGRPAGLRRPLALDTDIAVPSGEAA